MAGCFWMHEHSRHVNRWGGRTKPAASCYQLVIHYRWRHSFYYFKDLGIKTSDLGDRGGPLDTRLVDSSDEEHLGRKRTPVNIDADALSLPPPLVGMSWKSRMTIMRARPITVAFSVQLRIRKLSARLILVSSNRSPEGFISRPIFVSTTQYKWVYWLCSTVIAASHAPQKE